MQQVLQNMPAEQPSAAAIRLESGCHLGRATINYLAAIRLEFWPWALHLHNNAMTSLVWVFDETPVGDEGLLALGSGLWRNSTLTSLKLEFQSTDVGDNMPDTTQDSGAIP